MADEVQDSPAADGYYGDDNTKVEELDLSFLDEQDKQDKQDEQENASGKKAP